MPMPGRVAVTGANGFIGGHLVGRAAAEGWEAIGIVRSEEGARHVAEAGGRPARVAALTADLLVASFAGVRAVVHLAQIGAERGKVTYDAVNVGGTREVIEACRRAHVPRLVFFSGLGVTRYGMARRCTNRYFLSKLTAEAELFRSSVGCTVFRPSYVVGPGDGFVRRVAADIAVGEVELPGDGSYRMQPVAVTDAAAAILAAAERPEVWPLAVDLVGPEPLACRDLVERVAKALREHGRTSAYRIRSVPIGDVDRQAAAGGYRGMSPDELDCMLCDEVGDPGPLEALLGRFLTPLDEAIAAAVRALPRV